MKTYLYAPTKHPRLFRMVDRKGNWEHYALFKEGLAKDFMAQFAKQKIDPADYVQQFLRGSTTILGLGYAKDPFFLQWLSSHTAEERDAILTRASDRGDMAHRWIDIVLSGDDILSTQEWTRSLEIHNKLTGEDRMLTDDEWGVVLAWSAFWQAHEPTVIFSEGPVFNTKEGYAGTADAVLVLNKACGGRGCPCKFLIGKMGLWDWKSGGGIYPSYAPQLASYAHGDNMPEYLPPGAKIEYLGVLRIGTKHKNGGYEMEIAMPYQASEADTPEEALKRLQSSMEWAWERFISARTIAMHGYKPFDPKTEIQDIPDAVTLTVKRFDHEAAKKALVEATQQEKKAATKPKKATAAKKPSKSAGKKTISKKAVQPTLLEGNAEAAPTPDATL